MANCCNCKNSNKDNVVSALQKVMDKEGYISKESIERISKELAVPVAEIYGVATFYSQFKLRPNAKHSIAVCTGTACFVLGANAIVQTIQKRLNIDDGEVTADGMFELHCVRCLGCCGLAPVCSIDGNILANVTPLKMNALIDDILKEENHDN